jgi:hypothetical protein
VIDGLLEDLGIIKGYPYYLIRVQFKIKVKIKVRARFKYIASCGEKFHSG